MEIYGLTDIGKVRTDNQDALSFEMIGGAAVLTVCDGMGGALAGNTASSLAMEVFMASVRPALESADAPADAAGFAGILKNAAELANREVHRRSVTDIECRGMGTTIVSAIVRDGEAAIVNVGDSRAYILSRGEFRRLTRDHSLVADLVECGIITPEEARAHPQRNIITRVLGGASSVECDLFTLSLEPGDILLLCSDGLTEELSDSEILLLMRAASTAGDMCGALIEAALNKGASDNVTVAIQRTIST